MRNATCALIASFLITVAATCLRGAESPFVGTWKLDARLSQSVVTFEPGPEGTIRYLLGGSNLRYTFATDGIHQILNPLGKGHVIGKQIDSSTWQMTRYKETGEALGTDTWRVAPDGQTITATETSAIANNQSMTMVLERISGTSGLFGAWKLQSSGISYPSGFEIQPYGDDGLALLSIEYNATCRAKFDGKDSPCVGPAIPPEMTLGLKQTGPRTFEATSKQNGKLLFTDKYVVSPDGRFLANESIPDGSNVPLGWVYDRQ